MRPPARVGPAPEGPTVAPASVAVSLVCLIALALTTCTVTGSGVRSGPATTGAPSTVPSAVSSDEVAGTAAVVSTMVELADASFVDLETGRAEPLPRSIRSVAGATRFQASPNRQWLAFEGDRGIYIARPDGRGVRLVPGTQGAHAPSWTPDGHRLVYSSWQGIFVVRLRPWWISELVGGAHTVVHPNVGPDGRTVLFTRFSPAGLELWTVPIDGGPISRLAAWSGHVGAAFGSFGPTGLIAFRRTGFAGVDVTEMTEGRVRVMRADGTHRRTVSAPTAWMSQLDPGALWPMWSPGGTRIAYESLYGRGLRVVDLRTHRSIRLGRGRHPAWLDDDTLIVEDYRPA